MYNEIGKSKTKIKTENNDTIISYHFTNIVKFNTTEIVLNSGGFLTKTTKLRMNQTSLQYKLGFSVYQKDFIWYVEYEGKTYDFVDGMILNRKNS